MATNAVRWLRDYLTARDLSNEVAGGLAVDHLSAKPLVLERLPDPIPAKVRRVAVCSLIVFGVLCAAGALFVAGGALAVVLMPIVMGREGVGTAMITLFTVCVTFVISGILLLAARSAARVLRRERRGVHALHSFARFAVIVVSIAAAITQWLSVAFFAVDNAESAAFNWSIPLRVVELLAIGFFVWVTFVIRRYARELRTAP